MAGETPLECAKRELFEETGVTADDIGEVGTVTDKSTVYKEFLCVTDRDKDGITLQEGETVAFKWVSREELLSMKKSELVTERMQAFITGLKDADRYLLSPCSASSLPYWKSKAFPVPEDMLVLREDEAAALPADYDDVPYFKLIADPGSAEKPALNGSYRLVTACAEDFSEHIRSCYGGGPSAKELEEYAERPVYDPGLWIAVADAASGEIAATGVAELDRSIGEGSLEWIEVSPEHRRKGLGEYLVRELLFRMRGRAKFVTVSGKLNDPNDPEGLYTRCGFGGKAIWHVLTRRKK